MSRVLSIALFAIFAVACAAPAVQQPTNKDTRAAFNAAFADLRSEENRSERRDAGCRSNGDAVAADSEDCEILDR